MRLATTNDKVFDKLINNEEDRIIYNLLRQIKLNPHAFILTDDESYIYTQDSRRTPTWLFLKDHPDEQSLNEIVSMISGMVKLNPLLRVNGRSSLLIPILDKISEQTGVPYCQESSMSVCYCTEAISQDSHGHMITPKEKHRNALKKLISELSAYNDGMLIDSEDSDKFISSVVHTGSIYLWEDGDIVSIAKIAHRDEKYARINTVYTSSESKNAGYTEMLISELASQLLSEGLVPVIYADSKDLEKLSAYERVGFKIAANISQFSFIQDQ